MRTVCPFEPVVHPLARTALEEFAGTVEYVKLGEHRSAYWRLLRELWAAKWSFIVIEHDVEIHERTIRALTHCPRPWCLFPYSGPRDYGDGSDTLFYQALGCTRFRSSLMVEHPALIDRIGDGANDVEREHDWRGLDGRIAGALHAAGVQEHVHWPAVLHHHAYPAGCSCGDDHCEERSR